VSLAKSAQRVLRVVRHRHFSPYKTYVHRESRTVVVLNPKVATKFFRSLLRYGLRDVRGLTHMSQGRYWPSRRSRDFPMVPVRDYCHALAHSDEYEFYCFVRNPYARLKSAWAAKFAVDPEQGFPASMQGKRLRRFRRFASNRGLPGGEEDSPIPFDTFVAYVESRETGTRNHHWDEQYSVLLMDLFDYEAVYQMETDLQTGMEHVFRRIGMLDDEVLSRINAPVEQGASASASAYDGGLADRVHKVFARDFEVLGYDPESWRGL